LFNGSIEIFPSISFVQGLDVSVLSSFDRLKSVEVPSTMNDISTIPESCDFWVIGFGIVDI
jgi:hypothetical protein